MKSSVLGLTAQAVALAATFGLSLSGPHRASAAPIAPSAQNDSSPAVTILSPTPRTTFSGVKPVEISAFYQASDTNQIVTLELYVDGIKAAQKVLDAPETRGVVSFLVDAGALTGGTHRIVVRASAADAEVASAKSSFIFDVPTPEAPQLPAVGPSRGAPTLSIKSPSVDGQVQGKVTIQVQAQDPSGKAPYVSLFIDHSFKTLRNYAPYEFTWDTTDSPNGPHTIEAFGYNDTQDVGHAQPIQVYVNNPGGRTERRTDLLDATPKRAANKHAVKAAAAKTLTSATRHSVAPRLASSAPTAKTTSAARTKATPIRRRPTMLATTAATAKHASRAHLKIARLPELTRETLALTGAPGLSSPFIADTVLPSRPRAVTPTRGFKPLLQSLKNSGAVLAVTPTVDAQATAQPHLFQMAKAPDHMALQDKFLFSPSLPSQKTKVAPLVSHISAHTRTLRVTTTRPMHTARTLAVHTPHVTERLEWLRTVGQTSVRFNSTQLPLERPLTAEGSVLFGPLRQIFQSGGGSLMWEARTGTVTAQTPGKKVELTMGHKTALINQTPVLMDGVPYINNGRTMVPLSFLQSAMDVTVQYDKATGHLLITSNK